MLDLSTTFNPQIDGQSERTIKVLEEMLCACVIDFAAFCDLFLPIVVLAYNCSYDSSIDKDLFAALYQRRCRFPIGWFSISKVRLWGTDILRESFHKVKMMQNKLSTALCRQKEYVDWKVRDVKFMVGEQVLLKVLPMNVVMKFSKRGKLSTQFISPFKIFRRVKEVAYELGLPLGL